MQIKKCIFLYIPKKKKLVYHIRLHAKLKQKQTNNPLVNSYGILKFAQIMPLCHFVKFNLKYFLKVEYFDLKEVIDVLQM